MDLEILFWLVFILAPVLSRLFRGKGKGKGRPRQVPGQQPGSQRQRQARRPRPQPEGGRQPTPFEEALQQIQDALSESREQAQQRQEPPPAREEMVLVEPPAPQAEPRDLERSTLFEKSRGGKRKTDAASKRKKAERKMAERKKAERKMARTKEADERFKESAYYDEAFEAADPYDEPFHETVHTHVPSSGDEPATVQRSDRKMTRRPLSKWQEAFVMNEVLGKPRSQSKWREPTRRPS